MTTMARRTAVAALAMAAVAAWAEPKVEAFSPQGESKGVRQVAARFGEPMVAFGDPRLADPFTWRCEGVPKAHKGKGRWADATNWVFDFEADLPAGQRCAFTLKPDAKTAAGEPLAGQREFTFDTGGPAVVASLPREGYGGIDADQSFVLVFDAPVDAATLGDAWCEAAGVNERIPVQALDSDTARKILAAQPQAAYRFYRLVVKGPQPLELAKFRIEDPRWRTLPILGAKCARQLPAGAKMALVIGAGVKTTSGIARATPQRLAFQVRPDFSAAFRCQRVNKDAQCMPTGSMRLDFTAPVPRELAAAIRLVPAKGAARMARLDPNVKTVDSVAFEGPFPEQARFKVELPPDFHDDAGRALANAPSFPLAVKTDLYPALLKFPARFGILEASDPTLPVTVRGVEATLAGKEVEVSGARKEVEVSGAAPDAIPGQVERISGDETRVLKRLLAFLTPPEERRTRSR